MLSKSTLTKVKQATRRAIGEPISKLECIAMKVRRRGKANQISLSLQINTADICLTVDADKWMLYDYWNSKTGDARHKRWMNKMALIILINETHQVRRDYLRHKIINNEAL